MNKLGKLLVVVHLAICVLAMSWAGAVFLQFIDWGWKEPRQYLDERVASEYDKRAAALAEAHRGYATFAPQVSPAQIALQNAEKRFPTNHDFYVRELDRLRHDPAAKIDIKEVKMDNGIPVLLVPVIGPPVLEGAAGVDKSYDKYLADYYAVQAAIKKISDEIRVVMKQEDKISLSLTGTDKIEGLYRKVEKEKEEQDKIKATKDYTEPLWVAALRQVDFYKDRQARLEATLGKLKGSEE